MKPCVFLTPELIREVIRDQAPGDNVLYSDLAFSEEEILAAMRGCARSFNQIPPYVMNACADRLPADVETFVDGTLAALYKTRMTKMMRNDIDYTAGDVSIGLTKQQIAHFEKLYQFHYKQFEQSARQMKIIANTRMAYRSY